MCSEKESRVHVMCNYSETKFRSEVYIKSERNFGSGVFMSMVANRNKESRRKWEKRAVDKL